MTQDIQNLYAPSAGFNLRLIVHRLEVATTTNTARLAAACIPGSQVLLRGIDPERQAPELFDEQIASWISDAGCKLFLFPSPQAKVLSPEFVSTLTKPITLIVPDGSWRQAKKFGARIPALSTVQHVTLPDGPVSRYRLRTEKQAHHLCTFEAITRAARALNPTRDFKELDDIFETFVERILWSRGMLKLSDCTKTIPPEAIELSHIAGRAGWHGN